MKTTVEIPDQLLDEARRLAGREGTTLRLQPAVASNSWDRLREMRTRAEADDRDVTHPRIESR
jgi:hypothetical protein